MFRKLSSAAVCATALSLSLAAAAPAAQGLVSTSGKADPAQAKALCDDPQEVAKFFGAEDRAQVQGDPARRTIYLKNASYAVQRCSADGTLKDATLYELTEIVPKQREYLPTQTLQSDAAGQLSGGHLDYISPTDPRAPKLLAAAKAKGPLAEAPASRTALTRAAPLTPRKATTRTYPPDHPRCFNGSYNTSFHISMWPARGKTYYTNLPNPAWDSYITSGMASIDDRWNECGIAAPWRTGSTWGGVSPGLGVDITDGISAITTQPTAGVSSWCQGNGSLILACVRWNLTGGVTGPGGQLYRANSFDVLFNIDQPWVNGSAAGYYDVWSTATHEFLHAYGLGHVEGGSYDDWLVMWTYQYGNDVRKRWLAQGDLNGIAALYP